MSGADPVALGAYVATVGGDVQTKVIVFSQTWDTVSTSGFAHRSLTMLEALLATAVLLGSNPGPTPTLQTPPATIQQAPDPEAVELEDVTVVGRSLTDLIRGFTAEVAEPNRYRGLARWDNQICVSAVNLRVETAQYLVDRVSTIAEDVGLQAGEPGCTPNLMIVATDDGGALARQLVSERRRAFRMGGSGMDRGKVALEDFQATDRPVRWWQMSMPIDSQTGNRAYRIPGECSNSCSSVNDYAPVIAIAGASRLRTQIVDNIIRSIVIVDINDVAGLSTQQLADYIALVSLAQIDPDADTRAYSSILNVFGDREAVTELTSWDRAYLRGLYDAERNRLNGRSNLTEVVGSIQREHARLRTVDDGETTD